MRCRLSLGASMELPTNEETHGQQTEPKPLGSGAHARGSIPTAVKRQSILIRWETGPAFNQFADYTKAK